MNANVSIAPTSPSTRAAQATQALTFRIGDATYGVDIHRVREIRSWTAVTRIPEAAPHILGVLNLRGSIVPVMDLRTCFGLEKVEHTRLTVIIVLSVATPQGHREFGVVVDSVSEVVDIGGEALKPAPELDGSPSTYLLGLIEHGESLVLLIDSDKLLLM